MALSVQNSIFRPIFETVISKFWQSASRGDPPFHIFFLVFKVLTIYFSENFAWAAMQPGSNFRLVGISSARGSKPIKRLLVGVVLT